MKIVKTEVISVTGEQRQRYLLNCAKIAISKDGSSYEAKLDIISQLLAMKGEDGIEQLKQLDKEIFEILRKLRNAVSVMVSYKSDISNKVMKKEDVSSERFLRYREALSKCFDHLFILDRAWITLVKETEFENMTIPASYWVYVKDDEIAMPEDGDSEDDNEDD